MNDAQHFYAKDRAAWREWLAVNHKTETSVWLVYDKGPGRAMQWADIVQEALCFGWVDSRPGKVSDSQSKIYVSKRKPKSAWSKINKQHVETLLQNGLMVPAGMAAVQAARKDGSWDKLNKSDAFETPPELAELFNKHPAAKRHYDAFPPSSKKIILEWIYAAKTDATRARRITQTVELATQNIRANHYRQ